MNNDRHINELPIDTFDDSSFKRKKTIYRNPEDSCIAGVCSGIAEGYDVDTIVVRILAVMLAVITLGLGIIVYVILWTRLPVRKERNKVYDVMPEYVESKSFGYIENDFMKKNDPNSYVSLLVRLGIAAAMVLLFLIVAINISPLMPGTNWWDFWPISLLMLGLCLVIIPIRIGFEPVWHVVGILLTAIAVSILPMSLGIMSWATIAGLFSRFWYIFLCFVMFFVIGLMRKSSFFLFVSSFFFVFFLVFGVLFCFVSGEIDMLFFHTPSGRLIEISLH